MASNVELSIEPICPIIDSPNIDIHTQRPRTPNIPYSYYPDKQIKNIHQSSDTFFNFFPEMKEFDYNRHKKQLLDLYATQDEGECGVGRNTASRPGAYIPWGSTPTPGDSVCKHFHCESRHNFTEIDLYRRPPTNRPGPIIMKFGRPDRDYYGPRNPSTETWFQAGGELNRCSTFGYNKPMKFEEYEKFKSEEKTYVKDLLTKYPNTTEYLDRYTLENRTKPKTTNMEQRKAYARGEL